MANEGKLHCPACPYQSQVIVEIEQMTSEIGYGRTKLGRLPSVVLEG